MKRQLEPEHYLDEDDDVYAGYYLHVVPDRGESLLRTMGWTGKHDGSGAKRAVHVPSFSDDSNSDHVVFVGRKAKQLHNVQSKQDHFGLGYSGSLKAFNCELREHVEIGGISLTNDRQIEYSQSIGFSSEDSSDDDMSSSSATSTRDNLNSKKQRCVDGTLALVGFEVYIALINNDPFAMNKIKPLVGVPSTFNTRKRYEIFSAMPIERRFRKRKLGGKLPQKKKIVTLEERFASTNGNPDDDDNDEDNELKQRFTQGDGSGNKEKMLLPQAYGLQIMKQTSHATMVATSSNQQTISKSSQSITKAPVHTVKTWVPVPLLCKRFRCPQPPPPPPSSSFGNSITSSSSSSTATNISTMELLTRNSLSIELSSNRSELNNANRIVSSSKEGNEETRIEEIQDEDVESALPYERAALDLLQSIFDHPEKIGRSNEKKGKKKKKNKKEKKKKKSKDKRRKITKEEEEEEKLLAMAQQFLAKEKSSA
jgi:hypothetical protein